MKIVLGIILMIVGAVLGLWIGLWVMFIGGIINAVELFQGKLDLTGLNVALTICKIIFASAVGWISFYIAFAVGLVMVQE